METHWVGPPSSRAGLRHECWVLSVECVECVHLDWSYRDWDSPPSPVPSQDKMQHDPLCVFCVLYFAHFMLTILSDVVIANRVCYIDQSWKLFVCWKTLFLGPFTRGGQHFFNPSLIIYPENRHDQYGESLVPGGHQCPSLLSWNWRLNKLYTTILFLQQRTIMLTIVSFFSRKNRLPHFIE